MSKKSEDHKDEKKNTSLRLDKKVLKALKVRAALEETSIQAIIEGLVVEYLKKTPKDL